jgi:hypothetical protein
MWKFLLIKLSTVIYFVVILTSNNPAHGQTRQTKLTTKDKTKILRSIFNEGFEKLMSDGAFGLCTIPQVDSRKIILVRTVEPNIFPKRIGDHWLKFLSREGIESEVRDNAGDCFFEIGNFVTEGSGSVTITLMRWIEVVTNYPGRWADAVGRVYEATKVNREWRVKFKHGMAVVT